MNATSLRPLVFDAPSVEDTVVYLVDDEEALLEVIQRFLSSEGYRVRSFSGPSEALSAIEEAPPSLLLTDYRLPDMSGTDLARRALEVDPGIGILLMTGQGDEQAAREALALNALDYLSKPFDLERLAPAVRRATMQLAQQEYSRAASSWLRTGVARQSREIQDVTLGVLSALVKALETRYVHFKGHSHRVAAVAEAVARELDLPRERVSEIQMGALLHDIGMVGVRVKLTRFGGHLETEVKEVSRWERSGRRTRRSFGGRWWS